MAWSAITASDIEAALSGPELAAYRTKAGASDGSDEDKLASIIAQVTDEIRAHIEDCPENRLGAAGTLPERVHHHAVAIIRYRLMNRLGLGISEGRTQEYRDARTFLERVSECKVKIELPDSGDIVTEANTPKIAVVEKITQQAKRENLSGLY